MDFTLLSEYVIPMILAVCICVGYIIKNYVDFIDNKYIPLIVIILGILVSIINKKQINIDTILAGAISGLASTGVHQACKCLKKK